jgi:hypothetical protein
MLMLRRLPRGAIPGPTWRYHELLDKRLEKTFGVQALCLPCTVWAGQTVALLLGLMSTESLRLGRVDAYQVLTSSPLAFFSGEMPTNQLLETSQRLAELTGRETWLEYLYALVSTVSDSHAS